MKIRTSWLLLTIGALFILSHTFIYIVGDKPSNRKETAYILETLRTKQVIEEKVGTFLALQVDSVDWSISKYENKVSGMYGVNVSGTRETSRFRVYWESAGKPEAVQIYKITLVGRGSSEDVELWANSKEVGP